MSSNRNRARPAAHPSGAAAADELYDPPADGPADGVVSADAFGADPEVGDDATDPPPPAGGDRVAKLEAELAELRGLIRSAAAAGTVAPAGYRLVPDEPTQDAKSLAEQAAIAAEIDKGVRRRTQEHADRLFPEGKHRWRVVLADGNGHPELVISAPTPTDAAARYLAVCGVNSSETKPTVDRV